MHFLHSADFWTGFALGISLVALSAVVVWVISQVEAKSAR